MNPLSSILGTIIAGVIVSIVIALLIGDFQFQFLALDRWVHILAGIIWIGLLYYFNFVQVPAVARATADTGGPGPAGISKYVAPLALTWFRWGAVVTWLSGAAYLGSRSPDGADFIGAFTLGLMGGEATNYYHLVIGIGAWLGTIMLFNVWVLIWPNQKKLLGMVPATDEQKARAKRTAFLASRTNTLLSIPMLMCMGAAGHGASYGLPF